MSPQPPVYPSGTRPLVWAVAVGLLFAVAFGVGFQSSSERWDPRAPGGAAPVEMVFTPLFALFGLLVGLPLGALTGWLLSGQGVRRAAGFGLAVVAGAFAGMFAAALVGSETRVSVRPDGVGVEHGAPVIVLAVGAALGAALCALAAHVTSRPSARTPDLPITPGSAGSAPA